MANYRVEVKSGKKGTAAAHSRYDARVGKWDDREDLIAADFDNMPEWADSHPLTFWKQADKHERKNAAAYRGWIISLPSELDDETNIHLARRIAVAIAGNRPWQLAVHVTKGGLTGTPNPHMHLMYSDRAPDGILRSPEQYFSRYNAAHPEKGGCRKLSGGLTHHEMGEALKEVRKTVAEIINEELALNGSDVRVDHRSLLDQGVDRHRETHLGPAKVKSMTLEERASFIADRNKRRQLGPYGTSGSIGFLSARMPESTDRHSGSRLRV